ncbi:Ribosomal RNA-processing protein [Vigna angularis]|uniref:Ribosomal RNA-processing protein 8 n=1 Tax=Phaseolus angularis TaxID=3914 RepID=A0A8T0JVE5_PHAAN|nr:Ribosomal RNA-processing protein [Vigna angularis]
MGESKKRKRRGGKKGKEEQQAIPSPSAKRIKLKEPSTFLEKMRARLSGGHFRMINEKLYTCTGKEALDYFKEEPSLFDMMSNWPEQPVNVIIKWLKKQSPSFVIADFGCGEALIAKTLKNKVFSLDLVSSDPNVIACDMANQMQLVRLQTPLASSSVNVAVFCLSLMGTNYQSYIEESNRVLKPGGWLLIAEVKSRFDPNTGGADPEKFSNAISELGFKSVKKDFSNKMFILFYFTKKDKQISKRKEIEWPTLKPCLYKRR